MLSAVRNVIDAFILPSDFVKDVIGVVKESGELTQVNSVKLNKQVRVFFHTYTSPDKNISHIRFRNVT